MGQAKADIIIIETICHLFIFSNFTDERVLPIRRMGSGPSTMPREKTRAPERVPSVSFFATNRNRSSSKTQKLKSPPSRMTIVSVVWALLLAIILLLDGGGGVVDGYAVDTISLVDGGDMMMINTIPASWVMNNDRDRRRCVDRHAAEEDEDYANDEEDEDEWRSIGACNHLPHVAVHDVARALEYTSYLNGRMQTTAAAAATIRMHEGSRDDRDDDSSTTTPRRILSKPQQFRGGASTGRLGVLTTRSFSRANSTTTMRLPLTIENRAAPTPQTTIFHSPTGDTNLLNKSNSLSDFLGLALQCFIMPPADDTSRSVNVSKYVLLALAVLYLDRACAVDTPRYFHAYSQHDDDVSVALQSSSSCPFCSPATVHRLTLTALLVAASALHLSIRYDQVFSLFGITRHECETMMASMMAALGEPGIYVTPEQMQTLASVWHQRFPKPSSSAVRRQ